MGCGRHSGERELLVQRFCHEREQSGSSARRRSGWRIPERTQAAEVGGEETPVGTKHSDIDLYPII